MANNSRNNQGTGFVNFNELLNANQGAGKRMGQAVAGGLQSQADATRANLAKQKDEYDAKFGAAQAVWSNVSNLANQLAGYGNSQNWTGIAQANNPDLTQLGKDFKNYRYTGPTSYSDEGGLKAQADSASSAGRLANTAQGQQSLLKQYVGGQDYNQGQSQFDQALMNKYGRGDISQAKKGLTGLNEQVKSSALGAANNAQSFNRSIGNQQVDLWKQLQGSLGSDAEITDKSVIGQANKQGRTFESNADKLKALFDNISVGATPEKMQADILSGKIDPALIDSLNDYSDKNLLDENYYSHEGANYNKNQLQDLYSLFAGSNAKIPTGGRYFKGDQQKAAENLAKFLGNDQNAIDSIVNNKYDTNVFDPTRQIDSYNKIKSNLANFVLCGA